MNENKSKEEKTKKVSLYDCTRLFIEALNNRFPDTVEDSAIVLMVTDGKKTSAVFNGSDELMKDLIAYHIFKDEDVKNIIIDGLMTASGLS